MVEIDKSILNVAIITVLLLIMSCDNDNFAYFIDSRDGKKYKTVKIGNQIWMAENLNYEAYGSVCYDNNLENCSKYGRLYDWEVALKACPKDWHLPSNKEWDELYRYANGDNNEKSPYESDTSGAKLAAGKKLKAKSGWNDRGNGTNEFGFAALPGGDGSSLGYFGDAGSYGRWWSTSERNVYEAYCRGINYDNKFAYWVNSSKSIFYSVRCLQDY
jgi:uncharacterized protein (TIGR02145 family)